MREELVMRVRPRMLVANRWWQTGTLVLGLLAALLAAAPSRNAAGEKRLITFEATVLPADPFSDLNQVVPEGSALQPALQASLLGLLAFPDQGPYLALSAGAAQPALTAPPKFQRGEVVTLVIKGTPQPGYHTYPFTRRTADQSEAGLSSLTFEPSKGLVPLYPAQESKAELVDTKIEGIWLEHDKPFTWWQDVLIDPDANPGVVHLKFNIHAQVCNEQGCNWTDKAFDIPLDVSSEPALALTPRLQARREIKPPAPEVLPVAGTADISAPAPKASTSPLSGLLAFVLQGIFWGAVSLVTPCVFPMIPITVSFFLKQSEKKEYHAWSLACVYSLTIVIVLTIAAVALLSFFRWLSVNPVMNIGLGLLFVFFALSLFGMYDIELPSGLAQFTSSREGRGGYLGTIFMALTFTIISFACVAPFLGGFGGTAAGSDLTLLHRILGGLAFSVTFASPFFLLALFPGMLKKMPKSGTWLNSVKVVMGFLELAAAVKFFRAGELVLLPSASWFTYDLALGLYVAISLLCGLYLLGLFRLPNDTPLEHIGVLRMLMSLAFIGLGLYLLPGIYKTYNPEGERQRPSGVIFSWVDSFLLPDEAATDLPWGGDLDKALQTAQDKGQLVFIDFTGETCTNCKINEATVFSRKDVKSLLKRYQLVQLYTDKVPNKFYTAEQLNKFGGSTSQQREDAIGKNLVFQREKFNTEQLPLYVIVRPTGNGGFKEVARYDEGKINNDAAFMEFLRKPLRGKQ